MHFLIPRPTLTGDTANKIGTYSLALSALHHGIPFYVAAPLTSIDSSIQSGKEIVIEERSPRELTHSHGGQGTQIAATGIDVWNPAFDVTPAHLITALITDQVCSLILEAFYLGKSSQLPLSVFILVSS